MPYSSYQPRMILPVEFLSATSAIVPRPPAPQRRATDAPKLSILTKPAEWSHITPPGHTVLPYAYNSAESPTPLLVISPSVLFGLDPTAPEAPRVRPYLRTLLAYLLGPQSTWTLAFWSLRPRGETLNSLMALEQQLVWRGDDGEIKLHPRVAAVWGREDCGVTDEDVRNGTAEKKLDLLWKALKEDGHDHGKLDTVVVDESPFLLVSPIVPVIVAKTIKVLIFEFPSALTPAHSSSRQKSLHRHHQNIFQI